MVQDFRQSTIKHEYEVNIVFLESTKINYIQHLLAEKLLTAFLANDA